LLLLADPAISVLISERDTSGPHPTEAVQLLKPTVRLAQIYGREFDYRAAERLVQWLRANTRRDDVVLAAFATEPTIFSEADRPIVLHPKFETVAVREKVREFFDAFYAPSERAFHDFCVHNKARYFVFSPGLFAGPEAAKRGRAYWIYSSRYVAGAGEDYKLGGTQWMYLNKDMCGYFRWKYDVPGEGTLGYAYRIFEVVSEDDIAEAKLNVRIAGGFFQDYLDLGEPVDLDTALDGALFAAELWPGCADAWHLLTRIYVLLDKDTPGSRRAAEALSRYRMIIAQEPDQRAPEEPEPRPEREP
jgi:hypothetical protein